MKRDKDYTLHECQICKTVVPVCGIASHLYHKHDKLKSDDYARMYGEFRKKHLHLANRKDLSNVNCLECFQKFPSHKSLIHHINKDHKDLGWEKYFIKHFFKGIHPTCACGCGQNVKLLRHGKNENGEVAYARTMLQGHNNNPPGYRVNTPQQKVKMRLAAIKRMSEGKGTFFNSGTSKGEQELYKFIQDNLPGVEIISNDKVLLSGLEIDILIPDKKLAIEFNGGHFHSDLFKDRTYHLKKTEEVISHGYRMIHIWESDWYLRRSIVESNILNILGKTPNKVYARNTVVKEITNSEATRFCIDNHLQGSSISKYRIGLFHKGVLVSVMTFSKLRESVRMKHKEGSYELVRFCNKKDYTVIGGASKLFSYFVHKYSPMYVISYANRDWSLGNLYYKLGMEFKGFTPPGYWYVKSKHKFSRVMFQKHKLISKGKDPNKSEYQIMIEDGYVRVWDCGNYRFLWERSKLSV
ncbi:MAG TPA: hypothetical protein PKC87_04665 [Candidatus Absconditabacterales bacterium]|nr:hypothetical protein [Candidatus Absconditabacterales bacterium]